MTQLVQWLIPINCELRGNSNQKTFSNERVFQNKNNELKDPWINVDSKAGEVTTKSGGSDHNKSQRADDCLACN